MNYLIIARSAEAASGIGLADSCGSMFWGALACTLISTLGRYCCRQRMLLVLWDFLAPYQKTEKKTESDTGKI